MPTDTETRSAFVKALEAFEGAALSLSATWEDLDHPDDMRASDGYPDSLGVSFDEFASQVVAWRESASTALANQPDQATRFALSITLGNAEMQTPADIAEALYRIAARLRRTTDIDGLWRGVRDANGNTVGEWEIER